MTDIADSVDQARSLLERHRYDDAIALLLQAAETHPDVEDLEIEIACAYCERGMERLTRDERDGARSDLQESLTWATVVTALLGLGEVERRSGNLAHARHFFEEALAVDAEFYPAREALGIVKLAQGDAAGAEADFRSVAETAKSPGAFVGLADALEALGRPDEARAALEVGVGTEPNSDLLLVGLARRSDPAAAIPLLRRATELNRFNFRGWFELLKACCAQNDPESAVESLDRCLDLDEPRFRELWEKELADPRSPLFPFAQHRYFTDRLG